MTARKTDTPVAAGSRGKSANGGSRQAVSADSAATGPKTGAAKAAAAKAGGGTAPGKLADAAAGAKFAQGFSHIVAVLMRDGAFRNMRIGDLEWLVLPPMLVGQYALARARAGEKGPVVPVAVALWARVSASVDKRLSESLDQPIAMRPNEWSSGDTIWMIALAGDQRSLPRFLKELQASEFKGKPVKMRVRDGKGKVVVRTLVAAADAAEASSPAP